MILGFCATDVKLRRNTRSNYLDLLRSALALRFPVVARTLAAALPLAIVIAV